MKRYLILLILFLALFGISCKKKFLEVIDTTTLLRQGYVVNLVTTEHYMNGIYAQLAADPVSGIFMPYPEILADNMKPFATNGVNSFIDIYNWKQYLSYPGLKQWQSYYRIIRGCNFVLEKSGEYQIQDESRANNLKGQALAIRAWMHFFLVNIFAQSFNYTVDASHLGVPYVRTSDIDAGVTRQTVGEVYDAMIADLNEALSLLPTTVASKQYMNSLAAKALLARVLLFKGDYSLSKNMSKQVLNEVPLMTANYPGKLYTTQETEALFHLSPMFSEQNRYVPLFMGYYSGKLFWYLATNDITELYRVYPADKRNVWVKDSTIGKIIRKFPEGVTGGFLFPQGDHYQTMFRSTEMALTAAESYAASGMDDSARIFINTIRTRAGIPALTIVVAGSALMDSIRLERRKEMAFDGLRMFDLLRWKQGVNRQDALSPAAQNLPYPSNRAIAPIPLNDVELAGLAQNPDY